MVFNQANRHTNQLADIQELNRRIQVTTLGVYGEKQQTDN
jgi:hypothetical protein